MVFFVSFASIAKVRAQDQEVPAPQVQSSWNDTGYPGGGYGLMIQQGMNFGEIFGVGRSYHPDNGLNVMWQGNIFSNISGTLYDFQYVLVSPAYMSDYTYPASWTLTGVYINCSGELIPICLCNCSSFDMATSDITRIDNVPTFTNTVTFNNIPVEAFGDSFINLVFTQHFIADWTLLTIKTDVYADLSGLKLYLSNDTDPNNYTTVPDNTPYSLNFCYMVGLQKEDANGTGTPILPSETTSTSVYFDINSTGGSFSNADLSLGDAYEEFQGSTTISKSATAYFNTVPPKEYTTEAYCIQTFSGLTYGLTTGIKSDPTIHVHHPQVLVSVAVGEGIWAIDIVGVIIVSTLIISIANLHKKRAR